MEPNTILNILKTAADRASRKTVPGKQQKTIKKTEAYRLYGRSNIDRWVLEGLLCPERPPDYASKRQVFDRRKLETIAKSNNRTTYLPVADRT